jgi:hypothetical protein
MRGERKASYILSRPLRASYSHLRRKRTKFEGVYICTAPFLGVFSEGKIRHLKGSGKAFFYQLLLESSSLVGGISGGIPHGPLLIAW